MDLWNEKLTRENFNNFYYSTVEMVYSSTYSVCKETTRTENAIVKSYLETYQQRSSIKPEDVLYVFGDILLKNANEIVEKYPLPEGVDFAPRTLDEYTRNSMLEKITAKLDSTGYKVAEFMSSDNKRGKQTKAVQKLVNVFPVTPLLAIHLILLALVIWLVSIGSITLINRNNRSMEESDIYGSADLQDKYVAILNYYPLNVRFPVTAQLGDGEYVEPTEPTQTEAELGYAPVIAQTEATEPSATRG